MRLSPSIKTWSIIIALLIFAGIASAVLPFVVNTVIEERAAAPVIPRETEDIVIEVEDFVLGEDLLKIPFVANNVQGLEIPQWLALAGLIFLIGGGMVAMGVPIGLLLFFLGRTTRRMQAGEAYQQAQSELAKKESAQLGRMREGHPVTGPSAPEEHAGWSRTATGIVLVLFVWMIAAAIAIAIYGDQTLYVGGNALDPVQLISVGALLFSAVVAYFTFRNVRPIEFDASPAEHRPVTWGWLWVILSGFLILGLGVGVALSFGGS
ncbi:MAG: hypothetical protein ACRDHL_02120 [Candidatus Promineifilaceae bacterium]